MKSHSDRKPVVVLNKSRAKYVLRELYEAYEEQRNLFSYVTREGNAPQRIFFPCGVEKGSIEHRRWLFFAVMTDRREVSSRIYESHARLWDTEPDLYSEKVLGMSNIEILELLLHEKVGTPKQSAEYWPRSAETLFKSFGGDPLAIYKEFPCIDSILAFKDKGNKNRLPGFGPKILSMLSLFYKELGLMPTPVDAFPVDVHVQRFAISTGIVVADTDIYNAALEKALRPLFCEICEEEQWEQLSLSHALWFLGRHCCNGCYSRAAMPSLCPSYDKCGGAIPTQSYYKGGFWDFAAPRYRKGGDSYSVFLGSLFDQ